MSISIAQAAAQEPYCKFLGVGEVTVGPGRARLELPFRDEVSNPGRQVHGGVVSSMLGIAGRVAALSQDEIADPCSASTIELNVTYLSSAVGEDIVAEGKVLRRGKELSHVRSEVTNREGKPLGVAMVIFRTVTDPEAKLAPIERPESEGHELPPFARSLGGSNYISAAGIKFENMKDGRARLLLPYRNEISNALGALHEGVLGALVDTAGAMSAWSLVKPAPGMRVSTVSIDVNFCEPPAGQDVTAYAKMITRRKEIFFNRVEVLAPDGTPVAFGSVIYRIVLPE
ncbi:MAG TPA: PaaI family thioesterase [Candidatus Binataceae bacterium]|nr:PaaI family thioesterase [Candidatus Binataceae bacterium]